MFFIKALPISNEMNVSHQDSWYFYKVDEMNKNLLEVYNTYNVNILFTVAALPSRVSLGMPQM